MSQLKLTPEKIEEFLAHLREVPNIARAARLIGVSPKTVRSRADNDPAFKAEVDDALEEAIQRCEAEVHRRAFTGNDRPLTHQGQLTYERDFNAIDPNTGERYPPFLAPIKRDEHGNPIVATVKEYSDQLAVFLLKAHRPEKYKDRQDVNLQGHLAVGKMSDEEIRAEIAQLLGAPLSQDDGSDLV